MLYFLKYACSSPNTAAWLTRTLPATQGVTIFPLEFMLNNMELILPVISSDTGGGQEVGIHEKSGSQDLQKINGIVLNTGTSHVHLKSI